MPYFREFEFFELLIAEVRKKNVEEFDALLDDIVEWLRDEEVFREFPDHPK